MKKLLATAGVAGLLVGVTALPASAARPGDLDRNGEVASFVSDTGFDEVGYNDAAGIFSGIADGVDGTLDGAVWGDPTYADDRLVMKWSDAWQQGNDEGWTGSYPGAWTTNEYNGRVPDGSGEVWHYKIVWVGPELEQSEYWVEGGYPIWGQFEVIQDHGTTPQGHAVLAHGIANGLG